MGADELLDRGGATGGRHRPAQAMVATGRNVEMAASDACLPSQSHGANAAAEADAEVANATHQPRIQA